MKKIIKNEDLRNVNGGGAVAEDEGVHCPHCNKLVYKAASVSSGCNPTYHYKCDDCGYEWDK